MPAPDPYPDIERLLKSSAPNDDKDALILWLCHKLAEAERVIANATAALRTRA